jgi:phosphoribosylformylglycinamidine synthase
VGAARVGKFISLEVAGQDLESARERVDDMCRRLLCNGVIEDYRFELRPVAVA